MNDYKNMTGLVLAATMIVVVGCVHSSMTTEPWSSWE